MMEEDEPEPSQRMILVRSMSQDQYSFDSESDGNAQEVAQPISAQTLFPKQSSFLCKLTPDLSIKVFQAEEEDNPFEDLTIV